MVGNRSRARGQLEAEVLRVMWAAEEPLSVKDIQQRVPGIRPAYTTMFTVLERLRDKGSVIRVEEDRRAARFASARSESEHASREMLEALSGVSDTSATLLRFAGNLDDGQVELLRNALAKGNRHHDT